VEARTQHSRAVTLALIGIDLGTTNSALAWAEGRGAIRTFDVPQMIAPGETATYPTLPSFLYFPTERERQTITMGLPWDTSPDAITGVFAREQGALVPSRQVSSAKSWLSNPSVDRTAPLLPWASDESTKISPVEASARLLRHLRDAWNHSRAGEDETKRLERQSVVLTVPASFDEEARELTVQAARDAGLEQLTLLEEPLAALYAWIASHRRGLAAALGDGALVLVCDVGGGTTDFSLIRAAVEDGELAFERIAIGEHLLLGGDNLDLALAALVEEKMTGDGDRKLTVTQRQIVRRKCSAAKEQLLSDPELDHVRITILGAGRGVVGGGMMAELTRDEVVRVLSEGFLPMVAIEDVPGRDRRVGLRELGLPYESEPAITRHLAAFLARAGRNATGTGPAVPDAVLFNGGFFSPGIARERVLDALTAWSGRRPAVLENARPESSVAIGAAFYAKLRRDPAASRRLLIRAGSARAYYIGVETGEREGTTAVCVMPRGTQEGTALSIDREFTVITNQPAAFTLHSSLERSDALNALVGLAPGDPAFHRHAALVTALRFGKRSRRVPLTVRLTAVFTETGTLELWCESTTTEHRWRLAFNLRGVELDPLDTTDGQHDDTADQVLIADDAVRLAEALLRGVFASGGQASAPAALVGDLENALGHGKHAWPLPVIRRLADVLLDVADGRRESPAHEVRWLNLVGFCTRPGYGAPGDEWRITELRKVYAAGLAHPKDVQCQVEWLVLWQRAGGGFNTGQQRELAQRVIGQLGVGHKKAPRVNPQIEREAWRLLGSLERLDVGQRVKLGDVLADRIRREPRNAARLWTLGRLGERVPLYGPLNSVVPAAAAERWIDRLLELKEVTPDVAGAIVQIGARTGDPARDLPESTLERAVTHLHDAGIAEDVIMRLREIVPVDRAGASRAFGEAVPEGLRI
jgi:molecular chaperone DnaK (HSP70)